MPVIELFKENLDESFEPRRELAAALENACFKAEVQPTQDGIAQLIDTACGIRQGENGSEIGLHPRTVSEWIAGTRKIQKVQQSRIKKTLQCTPEELEVYCRKPLPRTTGANAPTTDSILYDESCNNVSNFDEHVEKIEKNTASTTHIINQINQVENEIPGSEQAQRKWYQRLELVAILAAMTIGSVTLLWKLKGSPNIEDHSIVAKKPITTELSHTFYSNCPIRFNQDQPLVSDCAELGIFKASDNLYEDWNTKSTTIFVPENARIIGHYQTWEGPTYGTLNVERSGYFLMRPGFNRLHLDTYNLFADMHLTKEHRISKPREMNDKLQGIYISHMLTGEIFIYEDDDPKSAPPLVITNESY